MNCSSVDEVAPSRNVVPVTLLLCSGPEMWPVCTFKCETSFFVA